jgi:F0F1-type ATP synthase assembly protein I
VTLTFQYCPKCLGRFRGLNAAQTMTHKQRQGRARKAIAARWGKRNPLTSRPITEHQRPEMTSDLQPGNDDGNGENRSLLVQIARYSQLALVLPAATLVGWLIGVGLDRWLHTSSLYLVGLLVGIGAGFIELIRTVMSSDSKR